MTEQNHHDIPSADDVAAGREKFWEVLDTVPFGANSLYQLDYIVSSHKTPARQLRQVLLELQKTLGAVHENKTKRTQAEVKLRRNNRKIRRLSFFSRFLFGALKAEILDMIAETEAENLQMDYDMRYQSKLLVDAAEYVVGCVRWIKKLPKTDRSTFLQEEERYWYLRQMDDARVQMIARSCGIDVGTLMALEKLGHDPAEIAIGLSKSVENLLGAAKKDLESGSPLLKMYTEREPEHEAEPLQIAAATEQQ